ncbi:MAG: hypothetical protein WBV23_10560 [Desulfobaccales bacterium]
MAINFKQQSSLLELLCIIVLAILGVAISYYYDFIEEMYIWSVLHKSHLIDELVVLLIVLTFGLAIFSFRRWREQIRKHSELKRLMSEKERMIVELHEATEKIKILKGFLPICSHCKKIRNDEGYWQQLEKYISEHSEAQFSHGICPTCAEKHYSELLPGKDSSLK